MCARASRFKFAQDNKVILVDDYDQINRDILPFLGMPPSLLRSRSSTIISDPNNNIQKGSFTLHVVDGRIGSMEEGGITGGAKKSKRANEQIMLLKPFVGWLPDMNITISEQDGPGLHLGGERRLQLETLAREGRGELITSFANLIHPDANVAWQSYRKTSTTSGVG